MNSIAGPTDLSGIADGDKAKGGFDQLVHRRAHDLLGFGCKWMTDLKASIFK